MIVKKLILAILSCAMLTLLATSTLYAQDLKADDEDMIDINFKEVKLSEILKVVAKNNNKRFLLGDKNLESKLITLLSHEKIHKDAFFSIFETIMLQQGLALEVHGRDDPNDPTSAEVILVVAAGKSRRGWKIIKPGEDIKPYDRLVTFIYPLKYSAVRDASTVVGKLITPNVGTVHPINNTNVLVITDYASNVAQIKEMLNLMDVPAPSIKNKFVKIKYAEADYIKEKIVAYLNASKRTSPGGNRQSPTSTTEKSTVISDKRTNSLIIIGTEDQIAEAIILIKKLDVDTTDRSMGIYVIKLKHTNAEDISGILKEMYGVIENRTKSTGGKRGGSGPRLAEEIPPGIVADTQNNSLIISGAKTQYEQIKFVLEKLDVYRPQVLIEAAIVEVQFDEEEKIGIELATGDQPAEGKVRFFGLANFEQSLIGFNSETDKLTREPSIAKGLIAGITKNSITNIPVLINALASERKIQVLDRPSLLCLENETGRIMVSEDKPVQVSTNASTTTALTTNSFDKFVTAEVSMKFTPHIVRGRYVRLEIDPLVIQAFTSLTGDPPPRRTREISTVVTIPNRHTLIMGGYVNSFEEDEETSIPFAADIPVLGRLFRNPKQSKLKTAIFIFITPHILSDPSFKGLKKLTRLEMDRIKTLGMEDMMEDVNNYYGQRALLEFEPARLEMLDYKSPKESFYKRSNR